MMQTSTAAGAPPGFLQQSNFAGLDTNILQQTSLIIVNYNGGEKLAQCVQSIIACDQQPGEILLVDNASSDGSAAVVQEGFPQITILLSQENLGFAGGNNLGVRHAQGRYLVFLNPDTLVESGWLTPLLAPLDADPAVGMTTSKILLVDHPEQINTCGNEIHISGLTLCRGLGRSRQEFNDLEEVGAVSGAAFAMRRDLFERLGGFDEGFFLYMEDTDLSLRARLAGYRILFAPASVVYHHYTFRVGPLKTFYQERNRYQMLLKGLRWRTLLALSPLLLLAEVVTWGFVLLRDRRRLINKLNAYAWVLVHWKRILAERRKAQALRAVSDRDLIGAFSSRLDYGHTGASAASDLAQRFIDPIFRVLRQAALRITVW